MATQSINDSLVLVDAPSYVSAAFPAFRASANASSVSPVSSLNLPIPIAVGDCVVVSTAVQAGSFIVGVSDSSGRSYSLLASYTDPSSTASIFIYGAIVTSSASSVTVQLPTVARVTAVVTSYINVKALVGLGTFHGSGTVESASVQSLGSDVAVAAFAHKGGITATVVSGQQRGSNLGGALGAPAVYALENASTANTPTSFQQTLSATDNWCGAAVELATYAVALMPADTITFADGIQYPTGLSVAAAMD